MVCVACRKRHHEDCPGGNWCDCQHLPAPAAGAAGEGSDADRVPAESALSWVRQG
jgi:hypothetical protein